MQNGDLAEHRPDIIVVVLEGVLCSVTNETEMSRFLRREHVVATSVQWLDLPIKRLITLSTRYANYEIEVITFLDEAMATRATVFLSQIGFPFPQVRYVPFQEFTATLPYQVNVQGVYDSDNGRLEHYGQVGIGVPFGEDWLHG